MIRVRPITTSDDCFALLSLDIHNGERNEYHLSISNPFRIAKFEIAVAMTVGISRLDVGVRDVKNAEGMHKIDKNKEAKLKYGKEVVEGDVNNGIEGRVKKKIQIEGIVERSHRVR